MLLTCAVVVGANAMYALQIQRALLTCAVAGGVSLKLSRLAKLSFGHGAGAVSTDSSKAEYFPL